MKRCAGASANIVRQSQASGVEAGIPCEHGIFSCFGTLSLSPVNEYDLFLVVLKSIVYVAFILIWCVSFNRDLMLPSSSDPPKHEKKYFSTL